MEGSLAARPENTLIYATSNRRHIIKETFSEEAKIEIGIDELCDKAEKWAIQKGGRSPRVAKQFIRQLSIE